MKFFPGLVRFSAGFTFLVISFHLNAKSLSTAPFLTLPSHQADYGLPTVNINQNSNIILGIVGELESMFQEADEDQNPPPADYIWREHYLNEPTLENDVFRANIAGATKIAACKPQVLAEIFKSFRKDLLKSALNIVETVEGNKVTLLYDTVFTNGTTAKWKTNVETLENGFTSTTTTTEFNGTGNMKMVKELGLNVAIRVQGPLVTSVAQLKTTLEKPWTIPSGIFYSMAKNENLKQFKPRFDKIFTFVGHPLCWAKKSLPFR